VRSRRVLLLSSILLITAAIAIALAPGRHGASAPVTSEPAVPATSSAATGTVKAQLPGAIGSVVRARLGDFVELRVASASPGTVRIDGYDRLEPVDPTSPARFGFVADEVGIFPVRVLDSGSEGLERSLTVGRIVVGPVA
jgi:endonuclease YncB( thermonuclease family)